MKYRYQVSLKKGESEIEYYDEIECDKTLEEIIGSPSNILGDRAILIGNNIFHLPSILAITQTSTEEQSE